MAKNKKNDWAALYREQNERKIKSVWSVDDKFDEVGIFTSITYQSGKFTIASLKLDDRNCHITCKGYFGDISLQVPYRVVGKVIEDSKYGFQVEVTKGVNIVPKMTKTQFMYFLQSFKGCGKANAKKIVDHFGDKVQEILEEDLTRIYEVPKLSSKIALSIINDYSDKFNGSRTTGFFGEYGFTPKMIHKIETMYAPNAIEKVTKNPYILCRIDGIGFLKADEMASKLGIDPTSPMRVEACVLTKLRDLCNLNGHTIIPTSDLVDETLKALNTPELTNRNVYLAITELEKVRTETTISTVKRFRSLRVLPQGVQLEKYYKAEAKIKKYLENNVTDDELISPDDVNKMMRLCAVKNGKNLTEEQAEAVRNLFKKKLSILAGSAGTGKTASCRMAVDVAKKAGLKVCLLSPTGRAARNISAVCGAPGYTIHKALGLFTRKAKDDDYYEDDKQVVNESKRRKNDAEVDAAFRNADIVIADEASMIDTEMARYLFEGCENKHLLLVGDPNQLPSVGPGRVLGDLMDSSYAQITKGFVTRLTHIFRQEEGSPIIDAAWRIQQGKTPVGVKGVKFLECETNDDVQEHIKKTVLPLIRSEGMGYEDYLFLSPMKAVRGAGVNDLNAFLRPILNPSYRKPREEATEGKDKKEKNDFQVGDKVMMTRNNYGLGIYNGSIGVVQSVSEKGDLNVYFKDVGDGEEVTITKNLANDLILAYAMTVHKSQGGQAPLTIVVLTDSMFMMLNRNLLYTAVTRAESELILIGTKKAFGIAAHTKDDKKRITGLRGI